MTTVNTNTKMRRIMQIARTHYDATYYMLPGMIESALEEHNHVKLEEHDKLPLPCPLMSLKNYLKDYPVGRELATAIDENSCIEKIVIEVISGRVVFKYIMNNLDAVLNGHRYDPTRMAIPLRENIMLCDVIKTIDLRSVFACRHSAREVPSNWLVKKYQRNESGDNKPSDHETQPITRADVSALLSELGDRHRIVLGKHYLQLSYPTMCGGKPTGGQNILLLNHLTDGFVYGPNINSEKAKPHELLAWLENIDTTTGHVK